MALFQDIKIPLGAKIEEELRRLDPEMRSYRILKKSLDARKKSRIVHVVTAETYSSPTPPPFERPLIESYSRSSGTVPKTLIIGAGPAGLFAALRLLDRGLPCILLERGKPMSARMRDIARFWRKGTLDPESNVCFGEGGAGCFSDGKLITRVKSPLKNYVMQQFVRFGAPEDILYSANPHVGSNKIRKIIRNIIDHLKQSGCDVHFETKVVALVHDAPQRLRSIRCKDGREFSADHFILATGHSAHDVYDILLKENVSIESKSMAMGFRIEHSQKWLNIAQYGSMWEHPELPVANYKITYQDHETHSGVYSFCMCPGGYVLSSTAQENRMVVNGMSNFNHGSPFANSGIVVSIDKEHWYPEGPLEALKFQKEMETRAQQLVQKAGGTKEVPAQRALDFIANRSGPIGRSSCPSGVVAVNLREIYPEEINLAVIRALENFERKMPGFLSSEALLHGIESRTSSPLRIVRNPDTLTSPSLLNLYPVGEGAGYAGGITSAAIDGIRAADAIFLSIEKTTIY